MEDESFASLVEAWYAPLYRFALSLTRREAEACDLAQQTFFVWAKKGHTLRDRSRAKTWLFTTLYREFLRVRKREQRTSSIEDLPPGEQDTAEEVEVDLAGRLDGELVMRALQEVDVIFRAPLSLFYIKDLSYQEIATVLDVPVGTVMSRLSRGKAHLRRRLLALTSGDAEQVIDFPQAEAQ
jgi:RNA polymerase sigma-70 factor (ECF subfamily)